MFYKGDRGEKGWNAAMDPEERKNFIVLGVVVGLVALCLFVLHLYSKNAAMERCVEEGRHNCLQVPG